MPRKSLLPLTLAAVAAGGPARAQLQDPTALGKTDFIIRLEQRDGEKWVPLNTAEAELYFNRARCECAEPIKVVVEMSPMAALKRTKVTQGDAVLKVGTTECVAENATVRSGAPCDDLGRVMLAALANQRFAVETTVDKLFTVKQGTADCSVEIKQTLWLLIDQEPDQKPDLTDANAPLLVLTVDGRTPPAPSNLEVVGGHEALEVRWTPVRDLPDLQGHLVFCGRGGDFAVFNPGFYAGQYQSRLTLCPGKAAAVAPGIGAVFATAGEGTGLPVAAPEAFRALDPAFLCSDLLAAHAGSTRLATLQNGIPYVVAVASVDRRGNASAIEQAVLQTPVPSRDFYRGYREAGGQAAGGFCAIARGVGAAPSATPFALGLGSAALALVRKRRRW